MTNLPRMALDVRRTIIRQSKRSNVGHIGSSLSIADVMVALYGRALNIPTSTHPERDRFILSKGHAALALYAAMAATGRLPESRLDEYCTDGSLMSGHPEHHLDGIEFSTGSLGHGLGYGAGTALAARLTGLDYRAVVLMSDAECNEGSVWEAAMFAAHQRLSNLVAIVDVNGQQALGHTRDVLDLEPLADRWRAFGWDTHEVDGHDPNRLAETIAGLDTTDGPPHMLLARTVFGKGVSYMESQVHWHYWTMSEEQYELALADLKVGQSVAATVDRVK
ncbi:MAG: transketolase [Actinomycetota bacterium]|nr:transketolase [Actinomycetota bacterium]